MTALDIPGVPVTILLDIPAKALSHRVQRHRDKFEEACRKQGEYLPSQEQMDRWFKQRGERRVVSA